MLAQALVGEPHLLILDEPTNHLDFAYIRWLEEFLEKESSQFYSFLMTGPFAVPSRVFLSWTVGTDLLDLWV